MPFMIMNHKEDPKKMILEALGDISSVEVFNNQLLIAIYIKPKMTAGGILVPESTRDEDIWQGKVGLVIKKGPTAFVEEEEKWFKGVKVDVHDWIYARSSEGWSLKVHDVHCRLVDDVNVRGKISHPDEVW